MKSICFISSCNLEKSGTGRLEHLLNKIKTTGLINKLERLYIINIGMKLKKKHLLSILDLDDKSKLLDIIEYSNNENLYELPTLELMRVYSKFNPGCAILYLQTKGISYDPSLQTVNNWIDLMLYWLVEKHDKCIDLLSNTDIQSVGCNLLNSPHMHYSGNFWWTKTDWLAGLNKINGKEKALAEWWLMSNDSGKHRCLFNSGVDHYQNTYPRSIYDKTNN